MVWCETQPMVTIRLATSEDEAALSSLHARSIRAFGPNGYDAAQVEAWANSTTPAEYRADDDSTYFVVVETDGEVAGFGSLHRDEGELLAMYVHPDHARQGVGAALLEHLEGVAREDGTDTITLLGSVNAVPFYEHHGYERVRTTTHEQGDAELECVAMRKALGEE